MYISGQTHSLIIIYTKNGLVCSREEKPDIANGKKINLRYRINYIPTTDCDITDVAAIISRQKDHVLDINYTTFFNVIFSSSPQFIVVVGVIRY